MIIIDTIVGLYRLIKRNWRTLLKYKFFALILVLLILAGGKTYQHWDNDPDRGAVAINNGAFG